METTVDAAGVRPVRRLRQRLAGAADVVPTAAATPRARPDRAGFVPAAPTGSRTRLRQLDRRSVADAREDLDCGAARPAIRSRAGTAAASRQTEIGRAACRERVCQYV